MIGIIVYLIVCFAVACALTFVYVMMRPVRSRDELKSWRVLFFMYAFTLGAPYLWGETLTRLVGQKMEHAINAAIDDADLDASLEYYKVVTYSGKKARVVAVARGKGNWNGMSDKPVLALTLLKDGDKWKIDTYRVVYSDKQNQDGFTFPPYY